MLSSWFKDLLFALLRSSAIAIDCLVGCFRVEADRDDDNSSTIRVSGSRPSHSVQVSVASGNRNPFYSLLSCEGQKVSPCNGNGRYDLGTLQHDIEAGESQNEDGELEESSKFHSIRKLNLDDLPEHPPTSTELSEEWMNSSCAPCTPWSVGQRRTYATEEDNSDTSALMAMKIHNNQSKTSREDLVAATVQTSKNKFVRFECGESGSPSSSLKSLSSSSSSVNESQRRKQSEQSSASKGDNNRVPKNPTSFSSPYATPFKLTDDMQTPGTFFSSSYQTITRKGKNPRIRSEYVYSVLNPIQTFFLPKKVFLKEVVRRESLEQADDADQSTHKLKLGLSGESSSKVHDVGSTLFSQLIASPTSQSMNNYPVRSPHSAIMSKQEDEKVDLQAMPFDERLEMALSGEGDFIS